MNEKILWHLFSLLIGMFLLGAICTLLILFTKLIYQLIF
jgi:hypothetical protein